MTKELVVTLFILSSAIILAYAGTEHQGKENKSKQIPTADVDTKKKQSPTVLKAANNEKPPAPKPLRVHGAPLVEVENHKNQKRSGTGVAPPTQSDDQKRSPPPPRAGSRNKSRLFESTTSSRNKMRQSIASPKKKDALVLKNDKDNYQDALVNSGSSNFMNKLKECANEESGKSAKTIPEETRWKMCNRWLKQAEENIANGDNDGLEDIQNDYNNYLENYNEQTEAVEAFEEFAKLKWEYVGYDWNEKRKLACIFWSHDFLDIYEYLNYLSKGKDENGSRALYGFRPLYIRKVTNEHLSLLNAMKEVKHAHEHLFGHSQDYPEAPSQGYRKGPLMLENSHALRVYWDLKGCAKRESEKEKAKVCEKVLSNDVMELFNVGDVHLKGLVLPEGLIFEPLEPFEPQELM